MATSRVVVNAVLLAVFALVCVVAMEALAINIGQPNPLSHDYTVRGLFTDADGLPSAADVRVAGVVVGKVTGISHDPDFPGYTVVTMDIQDDRANPIYHNGSASIRPKTLLGEKYVDLFIGNGTSERIASGGYMDPGTGTKSVSNDEIFNAFPKETRAAQQKVLASLNQALSGRSGDITAILPQLDTVLQNLKPVARIYEQDTSTGVVDSIFTNLDTVMQTLADEHTQLAGFLSHGNQALAAINARDNSLVTTLTEATRVQDEFTSVINPTVDSQHQSIDKLPHAIDDLHTFVDQVVYPQAACGGKDCGLIRLLTGTLIGQINYPNDQLSVSDLCAKGKPGPDSCEGEYVTNEYDSMFSRPSNAYKTGNGSNHSALSIVLSENCDTVANTAASPLPTILGQNLATTLQPIVAKSCAAVAGNTTSSGTANSAANGTALTAAMQVSG